MLICIPKFISVDQVWVDRVDMYLTDKDQQLHNCWYLFSYLGIWCDQPPITLPPNSELPGLPVEYGETAELRCKVGHTVNGVWGHIVQNVTCIGFSNWDLSSTQPCEGTNATQ